MLGRRQSIFSTPNFQFEKRLDFLFVFVMNTHDDLLCLPGIMENSVNCHGKVMEFYYLISKRPLCFAPIDLCLSFAASDC